MQLERWWLPTFACAWTFGLAWGPSVRGPAWLALVIGLAASTFLRDARARLLGLALAPAMLLAGLSAAPSTSFVVHEVRGLARLEGEVVSTRHGEASAFDLETMRGTLVDDGLPLPTLQVRLRGAEPPPRGARVRVLARVRPVTRFWNPTPHPRWPEVDAPTAEGRVVGSVEVVDEGGLAWLERARTALRERLNRTLPPHSAAVARALLLGDGSAVETREREALRGAGMAHLLAVSGLHVALLAAFVFFALARLLRGRVDDPARAAALATIPVVLGFALVAGGAPSVWRAATMATLAAMLRARRRRPNAVAVASAAILGFAVAQPDQALRPAFLLSAAATAAIVSADVSTLPWRAAFVLSLRTTLATAPLVIWCFGELPWLGVVANVVLLPIATVLLVPLAFVHALAAGLGIESLSAPLFTTTLDALVGAAQLFTDVSASTPLPPPSVAQGWILAGGTIVLLAARTWRRVLVVVGLATLALLGAELHLRHVAKPTGLLRLTQLDVGQGDGALVDLPNGEAMLIDAGGGRPDPGERALVPLLHARRRDALAVVVISHPHPDHFGGMHALLAELDAGRLRVGEVWDGGQAEAEAPHGPAAALLRAFRRRGIPVRVPCGQRSLGGARIEVGWPCPRFDAGYDANDNSLVLRVRHGERAFLFTGDVEALAEDALVQSQLTLQADVLKVPHHGSRTSSSEAFLRRVAPWVAVASQGRGNTYGHPHAEVVARFRAQAIPWLATRARGGVVIETDGRHLTWWSASDETRTTVRSREEAASLVTWKRTKPRE